MENPKEIQNQSQTVQNKIIVNYYSYFQETQEGNILVKKN